MTEDYSHKLFNLFCFKCLFGFQWGKTSLYDQTIKTPFKLV